MNHGVQKPGGLTRRNLLQTVGRAGGAAAVYETMTALGLLRTPNAYAGPPRLSRETGQGRRVILLGAGVAALTAAHELLKAGFKVVLLEAQDTPGGRSLTLRSGQTLTEVNARGEKTTQACKFDPGMYFNAGPGRIPYHHTAMLDYCKQLGVKLEPYLMMTQANFQQSSEGFDGRPIPRRRIEYDTRGYIAELLAKAVNKGALDAELTREDRERLMDLLGQFGQLQPGAVYQGTSRTGYRVEPGVKPGKREQPLPWKALLESRFWDPESDASFYQPDDYDWQETLFQPVGGMDMFWKAFLPTVGRFIQVSREVVSIENQTEAGVNTVRVVCRNTKTGALEAPLIADWCISTIPLPLLAKIKNNFSPDFRDAVSSVKLDATCKVGWQAERRFWEQDDQIYGGISFTHHDITQLWYPSTGFLGDKGMLTGAYNYASTAERFGALSPAERLKRALEGARLLHPKLTERDLPLDKGISIAWQNIPFQNGGWANWNDNQDAQFDRLLRAEGRFWIAGDQVSELTSWQEGAVRSAQWVVERIAQSQEVGSAQRPRLQAPSSMSASDAGK